MPDNTILDQIRHYQKDIVKCPDNSKRMIRCIERLTVLPITIKHLQETGVGRSVNELRKCGGEVGAAANSLVCKWKSMVKDEVEESSEESEVDIREETEEPKKDLKSDNKYATKHEISQKHEQNNSSEDRKKSISTFHKKAESSNSDARSSKNIDKKSSSKSESSSHREKTSKSSLSTSSHSKSESSHRSRHDSDSRSQKKSHSSRTSDSEHNGNIKSEKSYSNTNVHNKSISSDNKSKDSRQRLDVEKHSKREDSSQRYKKYDTNRTDSESSDDTVYKPSKKRRTDSEEEEKYHLDKSKNKCFSKNVHEKRKYDSSEESNNTESEEENGNSRENDVSRNNSASENEESSRSSADDNSRNNQASMERSSPEESENEKSESPQTSDSEDNVESSNSDEYVPVKIKKEKENTHRNNKSHDYSKHSKLTHVNSRDSSYKHSSNSKDSLKIKKEKHEEVRIKKEKNEIDYAGKKRPKEDKYSSNKNSNKSTLPHYENKETKKLDKKVKIKIEKAEDGSIDCESGASFGDALLGLSDTKKKPVKRKPSTPLDKPSKPVDKTSAKPKYTIKEEPHSSYKSSSEPILLSKHIKLEPLDVDLKSTLPEISPHYKPLPHYSPPGSPAYKRTKLLSQEDALSTIMSTKNQRTKVYSGNKSGYTKVPSLFELCTQVLRDNIDALEYTGGVPYDLLKPVLDRATADQLFQLEHHNPYLIEDTDGLWKFHCNKDFRGKKPDEFETWRELYLRLLDEREKKLVTLKANITQSMAKSTPIRQTKLAYVDAVVKPPRNVARQQMKHGTAKAVKHELVSKAMVGAASSSPAPDVVSVPAPPVSSRASNAFPIPNFLKKKKAPLMAKALQLIKGNRFKR